MGMYFLTHCRRYVLSCHDAIRHVRGYGHVIMLLYQRQHPKYVLDED